MPSLPILDIAIGLAVVYATLALACTAANEVFAQLTGRRAKTLEKGIRQLLDDPATADNLFKHPLVSALCKTTNSTPSYLPANTFALALLDGVTGAAGKVDIASFRQAVDNIGNTKLRHTLTLLLSSADARAADGKATLAHLTTEIENWYDHATDRFSGWYKRNLQIATLSISALLCISLNADTVAIAEALANDSALRSSLVAYAENYAKNPPDKPVTGGDLAAQVKRLEDTVGATKKLGIPLGWSEWQGVSAALNKFFGLLITILAVSLGAPFWFDLLGRFINIRSAGNAPKKAAEGAKT